MKNYLATITKAKRRTFRSRKQIKVDYEAFRASAGSWSDIDTDALIKRIYESRTISTRPPVKFDEPSLKIK